MVDEHSQTSHGDNQELHSETVMIAVVGGPELHVDQVDGGVRTADVDHLWMQRTLVKIHRSHHGRSEQTLSYLHARVVQGDERSEQVQVACGEHKGKQDLALSRDTFKRKTQYSGASLLLISAGQLVAQVPEKVNYCRIVTSAGQSGNNTVTVSHAQ